MARPPKQSTPSGGDGNGDGGSDSDGKGCGPRSLAKGRGVGSGGACVHSTIIALADCVGGQGVGGRGWQAASTARIAKKVCKTQEKKTKRERDGRIS